MLHRLIRSQLECTLILNCFILQVARAHALATSHSKGCGVCHQLHAAAYLSRVGKVTKLGLPKYQTVGILQAVSQLKAQSAKLRQVAVGDGELPRRLAAEDVRQGDVFVPVLLIVDERVAVGEGAALNVLPSQSHMVPCMRTMMSQRESE